MVVRLDVVPSVCPFLGFIPAPRSNFSLVAIFAMEDRNSNADLGCSDILGPFPDPRAVSRNSRPSCHQSLPAFCPHLLLWCPSRSFMRLWVLFRVAFLNGLFLHRLCCLCGYRLLAHLSLAALFCSESLSIFSSISSRRELIQSSGELLDFLRFLLWFTKSQVQGFRLPFHGFPLI